VKLDNDQRRLSVGSLCSGGRFYAWQAAIVKAFLAIEGVKTVLLVHDWVTFRRFIHSGASRQQDIVEVPIDRAGRSFSEGKKIKWCETLCRRSGP